MEADWITIALFLFFFVILPLLQGIGRRKGPQQDLPEADEEWDAPEVEVRTSRRRRIEPEEWTADWEEQPSEQQGEPARERSAWEELSLDDLFRGPQPEPRPEPQPEPRPAPVPRPEPVRDHTREVRDVWTPAPAPRPEPHRPAPVLAEPRIVSLERLEVDREAEHERFHRRYVARAAEQHPQAAQEPLLPNLHNTREIRRAIVVAEVLGKPRSLREHEPH